MVAKCDDFGRKIQESLLKVVVRILAHARFTVGSSAFPSFFGNNFVEVEEDVREGGVGGEEDWIEVIGDG